MWCRGRLGDEFLFRTEVRVTLALENPAGIVQKGDGMWQSLSCVLLVGIALGPIGRTGITDSAASRPSEAERRGRTLAGDHCTPVPSHLLILHPQRPHSCASGRVPALNGCAPPLPVRPCTRRPSAPRRHARTCAGSHPLATAPCRSDRGSCASDIPRSSPARLPVQIRAHTVEGHGHAVKDGHILPREGRLGTAAFFEPQGERDDVVPSCRPALAVTAAQEF